MAVCPFHQEKTPSLSLDPARGLYHCFGCGKGGDVFTFVQETQGLDFNESVELLARQAGIHLEVDPGAAPTARRARANGRGRSPRCRLLPRTLQERSRCRSGPGLSPRPGHRRPSSVDEYRIGFAPEGETWGALVKGLRGAGIKDGR